MDDKKNTAYLRIRRQASPDEIPYWETFVMEYRDTDTLLTLLLKLGDHPKTVEGKETTEVHHECNCKEEVCGVCAIRVNHEPKMSCSTLVKNLPPSSLEKPILLEPLEKFPIIRDLTVDRDTLFKAETFVKNWVTTEEYFGEPLMYGQDKQSEMYSYSKCIHCGSCYDACPRTDKSGKMYLGPAAILQVIKLLKHPLAEQNKKERIAAIMGHNGLAKCGKAQVCEEVCPKHIPLVKSIARGNREAIQQLFHIHL